MSDRLLDALPAGVPPPTDEGRPIRYDTVAEIRGRVWAILWNNMPFSPQKFYLWKDGVWENRTWDNGEFLKSSVPYKTIEKLIAKRDNTNKLIVSQF